MTKPVDIPEPPNAPPCFGCSTRRLRAEGRNRRIPRARWLVGDAQGHATVECSNHAYMLLQGGGGWAIPLASLWVVTDPEAVAELRSQGSLESVHELRGDANCPTYVEGFTLDRNRR